MKYTGSPSADAAITVAIEGVEDVQRALDRVSDRFIDVARKEVARAAIAVQRGARLRLRAQKKIDVGILINSIRFTFPVSGRGLIANVGTTDVHYARYIEFGTGPAAGHGQYRSMPPVSNLIPWARRHRKILGIQKGRSKKAQKAVETAAFLIARKLARTGTKPHPFLVPALEDESPKFQKRLHDSIKRESKRPWKK